MFLKEGNTQLTGFLLKFKAEQEEAVPFLQWGSLQESGQIRQVRSRKAVKVSD